MLLIAPEEMIKWICGYVDLDMEYPVWYLQAIRVAEGGDMLAEYTEEEFWEAVSASPEADIFGRNPIDWSPDGYWSIILNW